MTYRISPIEQNNPAIEAEIDKSLVMANDAYPGTKILYCPLARISGFEVFWQYLIPHQESSIRHPASSISNALTESKLEAHQR